MSLTLETQWVKSVTVQRVGARTSWFLALAAAVRRSFQRLPEIRTGGRGREKSSSTDSHARKKISWGSISLWVGAGRSSRCPPGVVSNAQATFSGTDKHSLPNVTPLDLGVFCVKTQRGGVDFGPRNSPLRGGDNSYPCNGPSNPSAEKQMRVSQLILPNHGCGPWLSGWGGLGEGAAVPVPDSATSTL